MAECVDAARTSIYRGTGWTFWRRVSRYVHNVLTLFSGDHMRIVLSTPTAQSFLPSQFHAIWVIIRPLDIRMSRGLNAGKFVAWIIV